MKNPYLKSTSPDKSELALTYLPKVKKIALHLAARLPDHISVDDLVQVGFLGLMEAVKRYDETKKVQFSTFAEFRIRGAMLDELRHQDWTPRSARDAGKKLDKAFQSLRQQGVDDPKDKQIAKELDIPVRELPAFLEKAKPLSVFSLDASPKGGGEDGNEEGSMLDIIHVEREDDSTPVEGLLKEEGREKLAQAITRLTEREQLVLSLYFYEEFNLKEIAATLSLTESRVSQIRTKALSRLRVFLQDTATADEH